MSFIDNILGCIGDEALSLETGFRAVMVGEKAVYIEGVKNITGFNEDVIELLIKRGSVKVSGRNMFIKKYCLGDVLICGKIKGIEVFKD
ncbi:MAG: hypothetical protein E7369_01855 [Clostridiales bacterium]|nr:hypothetical protein [Clostridiales bacterium]